jgi:hypothetical protein
MPNDWSQCSALTVAGRGMTFQRRAPYCADPTCTALQSNLASRVSASRLTLVLTLALTGVLNRPRRQFWRPAPHNLGLPRFLRQTEGPLPTSSRVYKRALPPLERLHDADPLAFHCHLLRDPFTVLDTCLCCHEQQSIGGDYSSPATGPIVRHAIGAHSENSELATPSYHAMNSDRSLASAHDLDFLGLSCKRLGME